MLDLTYETPKPKIISGARQDWELVIGMEVHAQVSSRSKLFSGASTKFGSEPNSNVAFVDAGMPGMLPVINEFCVAQAVRTGLGLKAQIHLNSAFDRKNYFYPDLPQGYQISQLYHPIVGEGEVLVEMGDGTARTVRIERIHLEQDAGKSIHDMDPAMSFVDLNRTGVALMEIVSRPRHPRAGGGRGLCREAQAHHALPRHLRRQHAERQPARRRERVDLPARSL
jgi:aspartyl-tRNA(Asn)/glutamyl-tRNA(Gln) amidotransferase subunit B